MTKSLKQLADELANYIKNGDDDKVKVSQKAIDEVIALLRGGRLVKRPKDQQS